MSISRDLTERAVRIPRGKVVQTGNSKHKRPEARAYLGCLRNDKEASKVRREGGRERGSGKQISSYRTCGR